MQGTQVISRRLPPVTIEYDSRHGRLIKVFQDAYVGRRFYVSMFNAGRNPRVVREVSTEPRVIAKEQTMPKTTVEKTEVKKSTDLNGSQAKILDALKKGDLTRAELAEKTGIAKGFAKLIGKLEDAAEDSLIGKKYVTAKTMEDKRGVVHAITAAGRKALEKFEKAQST